MRYRTKQMLYSSASALHGHGTRVWKAVEVVDGVEKGPPVALKDCWVDSDRMREGEILDKIHKDGWVPGVARHAFTWRAPDTDAVSAPGSEGAEEGVLNRVREIIALWSVGEPLSQCTTVRQFLYVLYDLINGWSCTRSSVIPDLTTTV